jgi:hypothetical protein
MHIGSKYILPLLAVAALGACADGTGGNDRADVRVLMSRSASASASASLLANASFAGNVAAERVALSALDSLNVTITSVEALPVATSDTAAADSAGEGKGGWVTLTLPTPLNLNLLSLPADSVTGGLQLVRGDLLPGSYRRVRLVVSGGSVVFKQATTVGQATFAAGQRVPLEVPSGKIKTAANFTVGADSVSAVRLVFDPNATVRDVTVTGSGRVKINPVLRAK